MARKRNRKSNPRRLRESLRMEPLEARQCFSATPFNDSISLENMEHVPNELLVQYAPRANATLRNINSLPGEMRVAETIHTRMMQEKGMGALQRIKLGAGVDMKSAMQAMREDPNVLYVEPNYIYCPAVVSNDPLYANGSLWGMYSNDSPSSIGPVATSNAFGSQAEKAWNEGITGKSSVIVGVIDEGIQFNHPDLIDNMWVNPFEIAGDGIDNDGNGYVDDIRGWDFVSNDNSVFDAGQDAHGTHVAGTIGATGGNGIGVAGVAWDVSMIALKFIGPNGGTTANAVKALDYLTDLKTRHGLNIVASNNSWGGGGYSQSLHNAILRSAKQDILFVAAAGNSSLNNDNSASFPANYNTTVGTSTESAATYDAVISVAAITNTGALSSFSNFGASTVDIAAPGSGVVSTVPNNAYASFNGTSMAAPHVTGAIALYASTKPTGTPAVAIKQAILQSATPTASLAGKTVTGGRLNVYEAVRAMDAILVSAPSGTITTEAGGSVTFNVRLNSQPTDNVTIPISSSDTTEGSVSSTSLVFTPANWNTAQTVTVTGVNDAIADGNIAYSVLLGPTVSTDTNYNNVDPNDINLTNQDNDVAGVIVSAPSGTTTTEAGGSVTFNVRLNSQPIANVAIPVSSSDTTEGSVSTSSLVFTPANWNTAQTVTVTGVNDTIVDGNIAFSVILGLASSTDSVYSGVNPSDISLTNLDDDTATSPATSFYVIDDAVANRTFEYSSTGGTVENYSLNVSNTTPRGVATNTTGSRVWVVDNNRRVFVYNNSGGLIGSWVAGGMPSNALVEGIATNGTDVWIVDNRSDRVYFYANAASRISGSQNPTNSFLLDASNRNPRDLVTDGTSLWVVNDAVSDGVFRYNLSGRLLNAWSLNSQNSSPTGITLDLSNGSPDMWVVDSASDRVYRYANARTSFAPVLVSSFGLASGNTNPQGIAGPPGLGTSARPSGIAAGPRGLPAIPLQTSNAIASVGSQSPERNARPTAVVQTPAAPVTVANVSNSPGAVRARTINDLALVSLYGTKNQTIGAKADASCDTEALDTFFAQMGFANA
ncbi:MAG: S8 family serine peptidase [Planctomycetota bacterium]